MNRLPSKLFHDIAKAFPGATLVQEGRHSLYNVDRATRGSNLSIDFTFGDTTINVPAASFISQFSSRYHLAILEEKDRMF